MAGGTGATVLSRHTAYFYDRGGRTKIDKLVNLSKVEWNRQQDSKTNATVELSAQSCMSQLDVIRKIEPRRHELVIFRGLERVWEGPIIVAKATSTKFVIMANDVYEYLDGTALTKDWPTKANYFMLDRIKDLITYELQTNYVMATNNGNVTVTRWEKLGVPANILPFLSVGTAKTTKTTSETTAFSKTLGAHINDLTDSIGVSFTVVGRRIVFWDGTLAQIRRVTEKDINGDFAVTKDGSGFKTIVHVVAQQENGSDDDPPVIGHAANSQTYYGPWESVDQVETEATTSTTDDSGDAPTSAEMNSQARRGLYGLYPLPITLQTEDGSGFVLSDSIGINDLVAGTNVPVLAQHNVIPVQQLQRIKTVRVTEEAGHETIAVEFEGIGTLVSVDEVS